MIKFVKMHGLGNDFMILRDVQLKKQQIIKLANRHTGVGFDQLLVLSNNDQDVEVFNADGSKAAFCGNGFRCLMWLLSDGKYNREIAFNTISGKIIGSAQTSDANASNSIASNSIASNSIASNSVSNVPDISKDKANSTTSATIRFPMDIAVEEIIVSEVEQAFLVNTGNEHVVCINSQIADLKQLRDVVVETLGRDVNVFLIQDQIDNKKGEIIDIKALCYERGAGETLACGSGAAAISEVYRKMGLVANKKNNNISDKSENGKVRVHMPGGILTQSFKIGADKGDAQLDIDECKSKIWQTGEVKFVFEGSIDLDLI